MKDLYSGSEIVELGIQIEKNGRDFYTVLARQTKNKAAAEIFVYLAGEEEKHIEAFKSILEQTEKFEVPSSYADEYFAYMNALAGGYVFTQKDKGSQIAKGITRDKEAVLMGIGFEKDSILFYEGMKKTVPQGHLSVIDGLIRQEQGHLKQLSDLNRKIS